jgi:hypothetical protein
MQGGFALFEVRYRGFQMRFCLGIEPLINTAIVFFNSLLKLCAIIAHGSPHSIWAGAHALSVIDGCQNRAMMSLTVSSMFGSRHPS